MQSDRTLIFLWGYMGAGKTSLAARWSDEYAYDWLDLDEFIEESLGMSIHACFEGLGEEGFRREERRLLHACVEECRGNLIVATGGGTPCFFDNMAYMKHHGVTVFLDISVATLCKRLAKDKTRPLLYDKHAESLPSFISKHLEERRPCYEQASYRIDEERIANAKGAEDLLTWFEYNGL